MRLTDAEAEAHNEEFRVAELVLDWACIYLYRGELWPVCDIHGKEPCDVADCPGVNDDSHDLIYPGDDLVIEVYSRATTSIFFTITDEELAELVRMLMAELRQTKWRG